MIFEIKSINAEQYRADTRRSSLMIAVLFAGLAMLLSGLCVRLFGEPGGDNFVLNVIGVAAGLGVTVLLVRVYLSKQTFMASAVYGWRLKRALMQVTNQMHIVKEQVAAGNPVAMQVLRFYHLGVAQMHVLDANSSSLAQMREEIDAHHDAMQALGLETEQTRFDSSWLTTLKGA